MDFVFELGPVLLEGFEGNEFEGLVVGGVFENADHGPVLVETGLMIGAGENGGKLVRAKLVVPN